VNRFFFMFLLLFLACACSGKSESDKDNAADVAEYALDISSDAFDSAGEQAETACDTVAAEDISGGENDSDSVPFKDPGLRLREIGWLRGDLHLHTTYSDADDTPAMVIAIAAYLESPEFTAAHPEYKDNGLDFIAMTDHNSVDGLDDPGWNSDTLILIGAEEFSGPSHANLFGITKHIILDTGGDGATAEDYENAVKAAHDQNGLFSFNHPFNINIPWPWNVHSHDSYEVWNSLWALNADSFTVEDLAAWENAHGKASPYFRRALDVQGQGCGMQALEMYEAHISRGIHTALVGGSDRHLVFPVGFPTTWIKPEKADVNGVLNGIRKRHTFVARNPVAATLELNVLYDGKTWMQGDDIPIPSAGAKVNVILRAGRAKGGRLLLVSGSAVPDDDALAEAPLGKAILDEQITNADFQSEIVLSVIPGDWFYPLIYEPLVLPEMSEDKADKVKNLATQACQSKGKDYTAVIGYLIDYIDPEVIIDPYKCNAAAWDPEKLQCMTVDTGNTATFFFPDWIDRALNVIIKDSAITDWTMGAVGSAVLFVEN
jgi:hypothetical protein